MSLPTVVSAVPQNNVTVRVSFSLDMENNAALVTPANYAFNGGLTAKGVVRVDAQHVDVETTPQVGSATYLLAVNTVLQSTLGDHLDPTASTATFSGISTPAAFVVQSLKALTYPGGNRIDLEWLNPSGAVYTKILRRARGFPYNESDGHVVYDGAAKTSHSDTSLQDNQFYYYLVVCSTDGVVWEHNETSRVEGLSIRHINSAEWLWKNVIPAWEKKKQTTLTQGPMLEKTVAVLGAGLDLIRGQIEAYAQSGDLDKAPIVKLDAWNRALNFLPETIFDHEALRRVPLHLMEIYKNKTAIPSIINLVWVLVQWECSIIEFGGEEGTLFKTWDGTSQRDTGASASVAPARGSLTDPDKSWTTDKWLGGFVRDALGNLIDVLSNNGTVLTLQPQTVYQTRVTNTSAAGQKTLYVQSSAGLSPYSHILIADAVHSEVAYVLSSGTTSLQLQENLQYTYGNSAKVYMVTDLADKEIVGTGTVISGGLRDTSMLWVENQWKGYYLLDSANVKRLILSNTANEVSTRVTPAAGSYAIAKDFTLGGSFGARQPHLKYDVYNGTHYFLYEPTISPALIGTALDPFDRLYAGITGLGAGFTNDDYAIFVKAGIATRVGKVSGVTPTVITDALASFTPGALVGQYLNPNRKQKQLFKIIGNTSTEIQLAQSVEGLVNVNDFYFILSERDVLKYQRLNAVLPKFHPKFTRGFVFFS